MLPSQLTQEHFRNYPPQARQLAAEHVGLLQKLPLSFLPLLLRELIVYDWKFPAERKEVDSQFAYLQSLSEEQWRGRLAGFEQLKLSPGLERLDWINEPGSFSENLSAHLWATHQIDSFRAAAVDYISAVHAAMPDSPPAVHRAGVVLIGQGLTETRYPLFRKLRPHGVYHTQVQAADGRQMILNALMARAKTHPIPFGHWYIDGGTLIPLATPAITCISYKSLDPVRSALVARMRDVMQAGKGPEALRSTLFQMRPEDVGMTGAGDQAVLNRFQLTILTEGSGTQIFSTTFVQWSAREVLRRAQPVTLVAHFAPRQTQHSMEEMLSGGLMKPALDPEGSLIDADMGAYYTWLNQQRLKGADQSSFLVWFEDKKDALVISPGLMPGKQSHEPIGLEQLLSKVFG
jgi:hypothetical protein